MFTRRPCSRLVYHWDVKRAKPGVTAASNTPRKNRTATAPAKFFTAANKHKVVPHIIMLNAEYFPSGSLCKSLSSSRQYDFDQSIVLDQAYRFVGYSQARYPK